MSPSILFYRQELELARRHRRHRARRRAVADARDRRHAALQSRDGRSAQGRAFHAAARAHGPRALRRLRRADRGLRGCLLARGHERIRRRQPQFLDARDGRPIDARRELGFFDSVPIEVVATVFTLIGAISFNEHFIAWRTLQLSALRQGYANASVPDDRARVRRRRRRPCCTSTGTYPSLAESLRYASFEVVTVITTNGYMIADFSLWPLALPVLLIFSGFIGGCAGSSVGRHQGHSLHRAVQADRHSHPPAHPPAGDQAHEARRAAAAGFGRRCRRRLLRRLRHRVLHLHGARHDGRHGSGDGVRRRRGGASTTSVPGSATSRSRSRT